MRLSRRLTLLILLCLLPMVAAASITLAGLYRDGTRQLSRLVEREVEIASSDVAGLLESARAVLLSVGQLPGGADCAATLTALNRELPQYSFLAVAELPAGGAARTLCSSGREPVSEWVAGVPSGAGLHVGRMVRDGTGGQAFLPLVLRAPGSTGSDRVAVAGLNLAWLSTHLASLKPLRGLIAADGTLAIRDGGGSVLAQLPSAAARTDVALESGGSAGGLRASAVSQDGVLPDGLSITAELGSTRFLSDVQDGVVRFAALGLAAAVMALCIAWAAGRRTIQVPAKRLIAAAQRWSTGDLSARADMRGDRSEFGFLGEAFNQMAADAELRIGAHEQQAEQLEIRVAERTRELSESNNRLQVEIAERKRAETVLQQAQKLQAVGQLAGGIAHDFNNLLATILGSIELIERRVDRDENLQRLLQRASDAVQRGSQLTSRLLAFSRRQRLAARPTDINRLVADLVTLATAAVGRRIRIQTDLAPDLWRAMVDTGQLEAAILNLALNARDAMPDGGVLTLSTANETVWEHMTDLDPGEYVRITVQDTGTGMSRETLARAFEPFFTTKEVGQGSGLGLSQVYGLAQQSGGAVRIATEIGRGTTVILFTPRAAEAVDELPAMTQVLARRRVSPELVLLVDDDPDVRHVGAEMLRDLGYEVAEAVDGEDALTTVRGLTRVPDLLVLDYAMPGMNGLQLAAALRKAGITAPILLATGYAELSDNTSGVRADAILHKPFSVSELDRTLVRLSARPTEVV